MLPRPGSGSSPQVRGKPSQAILDRAAARLIPAGAGKTGKLAEGTGAPAAHPRRCGENFFTLRSWVSGAGSSPQVRGKLWKFRCTLNSLRLIPAGAGKTVFDDAFHGGCSAHPRRCGENIKVRGGSAAKHGSSPQVRGKLALIEQKAKEIRLIPAGAGKTTGGIIKQHALAAHPRRCGENLVDVLCSIFPGGSSPQVRGKLDF